MFKVFFKIFFLVVTLGLFHGLAVLPVLLSIWGPPPLKEDEIDYDTSNENAEEGIKLDTKNEFSRDQATKHDACQM